MSKKIFSIPTTFLFLACILMLGAVSSYAQRTDEAKSASSGNKQIVQRDGFRGNDETNDSRTVNSQGIVVDDDRRCPGTRFTSIQAAVNASPAGSVIQVCPGIYPEQVKINKRITIIGVKFQNENQARIQPTAATANSTSLLPSATPIAAIILVKGTDGVTLNNLTIDGASSGLTSCTPNFIGIYYRNSSGTVRNVAVRNIETSVGSCQNSTGIFVQSGANGRSQVSVLNSSVHDYEKTGILGNEQGTELTVTGNTVTGIGPAANPNLVQNGIQIGFGAKGWVEGNSIINNINPSCTTPDNCIGSTNILVYLVNDASVENNNTGNSNANIYLQGNRGEVSSNTVFETVVGDGVSIIGNNNSVESNRIFNSGRAGIYLDGNQNRIQDNFVNEAQFGVLRSDSGTGNDFSNNRFFNTVFNRSIDTSSVSREQAATDSSSGKVNAVRF